MHTVEQNGQPPARSLPLSCSQMNIWNLERTHQGLPINNICSMLDIAGHLDVALLQQATLSLIAMTPALRTRVTMRDNVPVQYIVDDVPDRIPFFDFSLTGSEGIDGWSRSVAGEPMPVLDTPLYTCALFKRGNGTGGVLLKVHHLVSDAWSQGLLLNNLMNLYQALVAGEKIDETPSPSYANHIEAEQKYLASPQHERDRAFWAGCLRDIPGGMAKEHEYATVSPIGRRASYPLPERLNRLIAAFCEKEKTSPFAVFYMALAIYLRRVRGQQTFCVGVPVINRRTYQDKQTAGMFVTTLPFVGTLEGDLSLRAFNEKMRLDWYKMLRHQQLPFSEILSIAQENGFASGKLFDVALSYQNGTLIAGDNARASFEGRWQYSGYQAEVLCIHISSRSGDGSFLLDYDYLTQLFSAAEIDVLHAYLVNLLVDGLTHPDKAIRDLRILGEPEEDRVLYTFNATAAPMPNETLQAALLRQARRYATRVALIVDGKRISYEALIAQAQARVDVLRAVLPGTGHVVAIQMPAGEELFVTLCAAILSENAWLLLDAGQPQGRVEDLLRRSGAAVHITPDGINLLEVSGQFAPAPADDPMAYLVCTSGSTGAPKAVQVGQRSLLNFAAAMASIYGRGGVLSATNISFDAFLIESVCALLNARTIILAPEDKRNDPAVLADLMRTYAVGFLCMTPSRLAAYTKEPLFVRAMRGLEGIVCGGETYPEELLQRLLALTDARLYNQYGPSEATVGVTVLRLNSAPAITIGKPMRNCRVYVLDEGQKPQPIGAVGEIYLAGICLAHGYRGDAALTDERFVQDPYGAGRMYRTGDLGKWNDRGEVLFVGRKDSQLKLNGYRIEPSEIEARLQMHPQVTGAAVGVFDDPAGHRLLAAYYTATRPLDGADLLAFAASYLPRYMLPSYTRQLDALPITPNGKIDYRGLPAPDIHIGKEPPANDTEARLLGIWRQILRQEIDVNADYFLSGGDSLNAIEMLMDVERDFGRAPAMTELYAHSTVRRLAAYINRGRIPQETPIRSAGIPPAPEQATYPLTPAQQRFFVLHEMDQTGIAYNMPGAFAPSQPLDEARLVAAFRQLIAMDEMLRTRFVLQDGVLAQEIMPQVDFAIESVQAGSVEAAFEAFVRPFDLAVAPLLRVAIWHTPAGEQVLLMDMHHIISDGISGGLLFDRLGMLYGGKMPAMPPVRYRDWACWLESQDAGDLEPHRTYWRAQLKDAPLETELPWDFPRPANPDGRGARHAFALDAALSQACDALCERLRVTPYSLFASVFAALLWRYSGQADIVLGSPVTGRQHPDLQKVTGLFINTLPLRIAVDGSQPFSAYVEGVRDRVTEMLDHQGLRFDELVALAGNERAQSRNPLYNAMFSLVPVAAEAIAIGDVRLVQQPLTASIAKVDVSLEAAKGKDGYTFMLEYATALLRPETAALWSRAYIEALRAVVENPQQATGELPAVATADRIRLIDRPGRLRTPFDAAPVPLRVAEMAALAPDAPAIIWAGGQYTYAELVSRAMALAGQVQASGAKPGDRVGLLARRDGDLIPALLGIWLAGCAYLPLEEVYPAERMRAMLGIAEASLLLCGAEITPPEGMPCPVARARFDGQPIAAPAENPLAYVLFTSGSTGDPKGVMVGHLALSNLLVEGERMLSGSARVLCAAHVIFDIFATEVWLPLVQGMAVVMLDEEEMLLPWRMAARMRAAEVDTLQLTPSRMQMCLGDASFVEALGSLRTILLIGEPVTWPLLDALRVACPGRIINQYGPTEATVLCSWADLAQEDSIHIGKPDANCRFYALDENRHMVPPTARGELYIAGTCLAEGYIGRQDLTDAVFVADPFVPGERMYRSGDFVRLRADGNWDFLGRRDRQIKLDGHRIEIEEIVAWMLRSSLVKEAAVVPVERDGAVRALRGFAVPAEGYSEEALRAYLATGLPAYMIPGELLAMEAFPRTANGKTDMKALLAMEAPAPVQQAPAQPSMAPLAQDGQAIVAIWQDALGVPQVDINRSFFAQGGTSLTALTVLSRYYQQGWQLSMNAFYQQPTLKAQAALLGVALGDAPQAVADEAIQADALPDNTPAEGALPRHLPVQSSRSMKAGAVLLTGAGGFLGAHMLEALAARGETVICLVRSASRFARTYETYFGRPAEGIEVVEGDITLPRFGLPFAAYAALAGRVARVWHCAADVRHYAADDALMRVNLHGTQNVLAFAQDAGAWMGHVSTTSVCGQVIPGMAGDAVPFTERDLDIGQDWHTNAYIRSKALAEAKVVEAIAAGYPAQIIRVGRLWARARDGVFQRNPEENAFFRLMKGLLALGAAPKAWLAQMVELTPVDLCAQAALLLADTDLAAVHLASPRQISSQALFVPLQPLVSLDDEAFSTLLRARLAQDATSSISSLAEVYFATPAQGRPVRLEMWRTLDALAGAGFTWAAPSTEIMVRCLK